MNLMKGIPKRVILHCSATPDYIVGEEKFDQFGAAIIDIWHKEKGFEKIGYHYVIRRTGKLELGRFAGNINVEIGAHTLGHNHDSLGICLIGTRSFTLPQMAMLQNLGKQIHTMFGIKKDQWHGHCEFAAKECPGISLDYVKTLFDFS